MAAPLDYVFAEHFRQRVLCNLLDETAGAGNPDADIAGTVLAYLEYDFALHIKDEEEDLFPLLKRRAPPDERVGEVIDNLLEEHAADKLDAREVMSVLHKVPDARPPRKLSIELAATLRRFAANERQHLTIENAIILPLARAHLTRQDLLTLGQRMAARRGMAYPETNHAE